MKTFVKVTQYDVITLLHFLIVYQIFIFVDKFIIKYFCQSNLSMILDIYAKLFEIGLGFVFQTHLQKKST